MPNNQQRTTKRRVPTLTIHCAGTPSDALRIKDADFDVGYINIQTVDLANDERTGPAVLLDRDKARELFNWLGVWLHTV